MLRVGTYGLSKRRGVFRCVRECGRQTAQRTAICGVTVIGRKHEEVQQRSGSGITGIQVSEAPD